MEDLNKNVSLVITPELELCIRILPFSDALQLIKALIDTIQGDYVDPEELSILCGYAYSYFTGPDYNIKDLILPRLSK